MAEEGTPVDDRELNILVISIKPVAFIPHDPEVWFAALEMQFVARNVRSECSKYVYAVESIPAHRMTAITNNILKPPEKNAKDVLKAVVFQFYTPSNEERLCQLLARHPIGDTTPSRLLARLRTLASPETAHSDMVRELWLELLPRTVQPTVMTLLEDSSIDKAASIADKIVARVGNKDHFLVATTSQPYRRNWDTFAVRLLQPRQKLMHHCLSLKDRIPLPVLRISRNSL
ncbi:unnamed protein product [Echinostoma caproni]|uniref:Vitellogenin domain-containing protein n=1 Tax=Echinostoma caproni TaxID=27848 RepID=A0A183A0A0_9TREM|nr:unnamed protein product [Echinostoma caproni]